MKRVEWAEEDSNLRCFFVADLQSAVFAAGPPAQDRRAVNSPNNGPRFNIFGSGAPTYIVLLYLWIAVNPDRTTVTNLDLVQAPFLIKTSKVFVLLFILQQYFSRNGYTFPQRLELLAPTLVSILKYLMGMLF